MELTTIVAIAGIACASVALAAVAATEAALERANDVRINALANRGNRQALRIAGEVGQPGRYLGALTSARVLTSSVILGAFAYLGAREHSPFTGAFGFALIGGVFVAFIQMTVGLVIARGPERAALQLSGVARVTNLVFAAPAFILGLPSRLVAVSIRAVTPDAGIDILSLVEREEAAGGVEEQERRMIRGIIDLEDKAAREIMVPRIDMAAADIEDHLDEIAAIVTERGYSRVPVYRENIDDIVGILYAKDLLRALTAGGRERPLQELLREPFFIPESKRLDELLTEMQARRTHMAIVVDEYGGTAGLVTIEDLLEEIVGEIEDEFDDDDEEYSGIYTLADGSHRVAGDATVAAVNQAFGVRLPEDEFETIGGLVADEIGHVPRRGETAEVGGLRLSVMLARGGAVRWFRVVRAGGAKPGQA